MVSAGEAEAARAAFAQALAFDSGLAEAHYQLGLIDADQGKWSEAADDFRRSLAASPNHISAHLVLGEMYLRVGDFEQAASELNTVIGLNAREPGARGARRRGDRARERRPREARWRRLGRLHECESLRVSAKELFDWRRRRRARRRGN